MLGSREVSSSKPILSKDYTNVVQDYKCCLIGFESYFPSLYLILMDPYQVLGEIQAVERLVSIHLTNQLVHESYLMILVLTLRNLSEGMTYFRRLEAT